MYSSEPKLKPDYNTIYHNAINRVLNQTKIHQAIFYGVKYIVSMPESEKLHMNDLLLKFDIIHTITNLISLITPMELLQIFPVDGEEKSNEYQ